MGIYVVLIRILYIIVVERFIKKRDKSIRVIFIFLYLFLNLMIKSILFLFKGRFIYLFLNIIIFLEN